MKKNNIFKLLMFAVYTALIIVLAFTVGYLRFGPLSITIIPVVVALGAVTLGPLAGAGLGLVFGLTSFVQCFGLDAFGTFLSGINPVYTAIVCLVPRILCGLVPGLIYKHLNSKTPALFLAGFSAAVTNTLLFMASLFAFFATNSNFVNQYGKYSFIGLIVAMAGINAVCEIIASTILTPPLALAVNKSLKKLK